MMNLKRGFPVKKPQGGYMEKPFYLHKRGGVFYACLVNQETGERDKESAMITVSGWLRDGLPDKSGVRRKAGAALGLDTILRNIRKAELDSAGALAIVQSLKERGLIDIGAVPAGGAGSADFTGFLFDFFDYDKSAYVRDRLAHGHSIGRLYCGESTKLIRRYWAPVFKGRTLGSITRADLKTFSLSLPPDYRQGIRTA
jgi:hypothetical protein